jgi:tetratricopeptide (TPR) repeat protein
LSPPDSEPVDESEKSLSPLPETGEETPEQPPAETELTPEERMAEEVAGEPFEDEGEPETEETGEQPEPDLAGAEQSPASTVEVGEPRIAEPTQAVDEAGYAQLVAEAGKLEKKGRRRKAAALYEQALALNPNGSQALSKMAFHYLNKGKNKLAADHAARALVGDPQSSEAWIVLGAARDALRDKTGAREAYRQCVEVGKGVYVQECKRMLR